MRRAAALSAVIIIVAFCISFFLFVKSNAPLGPPVDFFSPVSGNFTGTTTITTSFGYVCVASHVSGAATATTFIDESTIITTTLAGVGVVCHPELFGYLQVPTGPGIILVWLVAFVVAIAAWAFYFRAPHSTAKTADSHQPEPSPA